LNTGHWVQAEDPKGFIKMVFDFIDEEWEGGGMWYSVFGEQYSVIGVS
jgi:hypothetical protein